MSSDDRAYRIVVRFEKDKERFVASVPELEVTGSGVTRAEAIAQAEEALDSRLQAVASGEPVPPPSDVLAPPEALSIKLSASAYRDLAYAASLDRISVEALATELIARGIGYRERAGAAPRRPIQARAPFDSAADPDAQPTQDPAQRPQPQRDDRGPPRGRQREGYRPDLDNQANFMDYVRNNEQGGGNRGGGNQGGGAPGGGGNQGGGGRNRGRR